MTLISLDHLRRHAAARTLFAPTTLGRAIDRLGFVQADPIRAPARAQDLTLRHRVSNYLAGDLERRYEKLAIEEDCLVNYGFLPRAHVALMHPRVARRAWDAATRQRAQEVLAFVRERGATHPREVLAEFAHHGRIKGYWGGTLNASTQLLDGMHYRGLLRVARREAGTRVYEAVEREPADDSPTGRRARADALLALIIAKYAPLPSASLGYLASLLGYGAPQLREDTRAALARARATLPSAEVDGVRWFWPEGESPASKRWATAIERDAGRVRLLAPFDPIVWDRRRFELLWDWAYKFEAYTPAPQRKLGYYALPLLRGEQVLGWANVDAKNGGLGVELGSPQGRPPRDAAFRRELEAEVERLREFLGRAELPTR
ncbi:DNA glycosylase AlkZ-like family protein [Rivibacter subsaxonicus]|uniref:Winged helix DNA-binding protein n=1 Tax=Rivibacter subsaxonicus TaxID=457575 RepID=A0A4Q7VZB3_9BURK|nr:crosslink repair DNA glycosylase YcaQ family protein [Rivibacter subsaxonicus]RZU02191.1 hypothetical protein EV670_0212 [Rivibacter subsaxonicus]